MPIKNSDTLINGQQNLSERETEVLVLCADGFSNKEIASRLYISGDTIDTHCRNIAAKLHAKNMKHAVAIGMRKGIIK